MGIAVEFNPDLALRNYAEYRAGRRKRGECIPSTLQKNKVYSFLKKEQRLYWLAGELPLVETKGNQKLSKPIASVVIIEATHFMKKGELWTKGRYKVMEVFDDNKVHFDGFTRI